MAIGRRISASLINWKRKQSVDRCPSSVMNGPSSASQGSIPEFRQGRIVSARCPPPRNNVNDTPLWHFKVLEVNKRSKWTCSDLFGKTRRSRAGHRAVESRLWNFAQGHCFPPVGPFPPTCECATRASRLATAEPLWCRITCRLIHLNYPVLFGTTFKHETSVSAVHVLRLSCRIPPVQTR